MSTRYQIIIANAPESSAFASLAYPLRLCIIPIGDCTWGVYCPELSPSSFDLYGKLATHASARLGQALHATYDDGCGLCHAVLCVNGAQYKVFDEDDELCVPVDADGLPDDNAAPVPRGELDADIDYECVHTAICAGLHALGVDRTINADNVMDAVLDDAVCLEIEPT